MMLRPVAVVSLLLICVATAGTQEGTRELEKLSGTWEITALIENGTVIPQRTVKEQMVKEGVMTIQGTLVRFVNPVTLKQRELPFIVDPTQGPKSIDIAGAKLTGSKGIYLLDGDTLMLCLNGVDSDSRPTMFASTPGSHVVLFTLRRVRPVPAVTTEVVVAVKPVETKPKNRDVELRRHLIGTWGFQTSDVIEYTTFNPDNSFSTLLTWKQGFRRVFHDEERWSGTWDLIDGILTMRITASTEPSRIVGQVFSHRILSISPTQVTYADTNGMVRMEWRTP